LYAVSRLGLSSSKGTSTVNRTRVGFRVSRALFTVSGLLGATTTAYLPAGADQGKGSRSDWTV
jgi:hypothetical protein